MQKVLKISMTRQKLQRIKIALCLLAFIFVVSFAVAKKTPKIKLFTTSVNVGHISKDNRVQTFVIDFKNAGKASLFIRKVVPDCSCTQVEIVNRRTEPEERGQLKVILDLRPFLPGEIEKKVAVYTNASKEIVYFTIKGYID